MIDACVDAWVDGHRHECIQTGFLHPFNGQLFIYPLVNLFQWLMNGRMDGWKDGLINSFIHSLTALFGH